MNIKININWTRAKKIVIFSLFLINIWDFSVIILYLNVLLVHKSLICEELNIWVIFLHQTDKSWCLIWSQLPQKTMSLEMAFFMRLRHRVKFDKKAPKIDHDPCPFKSLSLYRKWKNRKMKNIITWGIRLRRWSCF